jgi:hypothetical protein
MAVDVLEILRIYYKITAFTSEIVGSILTADSGQSCRQCSMEYPGFSTGAAVSSPEYVDRMGWD